MRAYLANEWTTVLRWDQRGRLRGRRGLGSPYLEMPAIVEGETGAVLGECFGCGCFREDVRFTSIAGTFIVDGDREIYDPTAAVDLCAACRKRVEIET
jgi:hypothetical protein